MHTDITVVSFLEDAMIHRAHVAEVQGAYYCNCSMHPHDPARPPVHTHTHTHSLTHTRTTRLYTHTHTHTNTHKHTHTHTHNTLEYQDRRLRAAGAAQFTAEEPLVNGHNRAEYRRDDEPDYCQK
jgi:hypothetical protein